MESASNTSVNRIIGVVITFAGFIAGGGSVAAAGDTMPVAQQNELVQKHCAVCHNDAARNGGLSLEHFDAAQTAPSLAAMMLSKLTSGIPLDIVKKAASDPRSAALVANAVKSGAINAAGLAMPDNDTTASLVNALASKAAGANEWHVTHSQHPATHVPMISASILRELHSAANTGRQAASYRLVLTCNAVTHDGEIQVAWAPVPKNGTLLVALDGKTPSTHQVDGSEKMGNGSQGAAGPAAVSLYESKRDLQTQKMPLPKRTLTISNLFPGETVVFPFDTLTKADRQALSTCFPGSSSAQ